MTKKYLFISLLALFVSINTSISSGIARELSKPDSIAVYFYADWCGNCKILSPRIKQVKNQNNLKKQNVVFVTLDLTDKPRVHQSILLAQALGIGDFLKAQGSKTGYIAVLDITNKKELKRFTSDDSIETIENYFASLANQ